MPESPDEDRLAGVQPGFGLIPDEASRPVDHIGIDLFATVRGETMENDHVFRRERDELAIHAEPFEGHLPALGVLFLTHARPHIGADHVGTFARALGIADHGDLRPLLARLLDFARRRLETGRTGNHELEAQELAASIHERAMLLPSPTHA